MSHDSLSNAKTNKDDEFYTLYEDIEREIEFYGNWFREKAVYCNCDDPRKSNFTKFFKDNFKKLGIASLTCTYFDSSKLGNNQQRLDLWVDGSVDEPTYMFRMDKDNPQGTYIKINGNGDFRSKECVRLLKQSDVIVTNPPFSLTMEHMEMLIRYGKKFLVIGNKNAATYKSIFPQIMENKMWLGATVPNKFITPEGEITDKVNGLCRWFTNIPYNTANNILVLKEKYDPEKYPTYDNGGAIEVSKTSDIPCDYYGVMGVPITFLDKYNPKQFKIIGMANSGTLIGYDFFRPEIDGKCAFKRILIRRKK